MFGMLATAFPSSEFQTALRVAHLSAPPAVTAAFAATTRSLVEVIAGLTTQIHPWGV